MRLVPAPASRPSLPGGLFLAGSIEQGVADDWQTRVIRALETTTATIYNPRRPDWDASWVQRADNPQFREQVEWELRAMERVDRILLYFDPATKSPISLLELGLFHAKMVVCCPEGFWRKGNVDIVCERYSVPTVRTLDQLVDTVVNMPPWAPS